jgi:predicted RNA binding protein YcfA (HicA-like mRNA interferase family)
MPQPISRKALVKKLHSLGFDGPYSGGKHQYVEKNGFKIFIPNPHNGDIGTVLLGRIVKEIGITYDKFMDL